MTTLRLLAGPTAYQHIQDRGLSPKDITAVFGASGAAKWLSIYGLDRAIFDTWLSTTQHPIDLFGTSVGAFKLAAAAQQNPADALDKLAEAYVYQNYQGKITAEQVAAEVENILDAFLSTDKIDEVLSNPRFNFQCGSVLCKGWLASENPNKQKAVMAKALLSSPFGKSQHRTLFDRAIFQAKASAEANTFKSSDGFNSHRIQLSADNFRQAILSSGSIPVAMLGVTDIPGAPAGTYRDGGLLDYHPLPTNISDISEGLVLYPHFYSYLKEGWFDKFWPWRKASKQQLDRTLIICPSDSYIASLPNGRIPDRQDFYRFKDNDQERIRHWRIAMERSLELGEEFIQLANSGDIAANIELIA